MMRRMLGRLARRPQEALLLAALDGVLLVGAVLLAHWLRFNPADRAVHLARLAEHPGLSLVGLVGLWVVATAAELYQSPPLLPGERALRVAFAALAWGVVLVLATYLVPEWKFGRGLLLATTASWGLGAFALRSALDHHRQQREKPPAWLVGEGEELGPLLHLGQNPACPWRLLPVSPQALEKPEGTEEPAVVFVVDPRRLPGLVGLHFAGVPVVPAWELWALVEGRLPVDLLAPETFLYQREFVGIHWEVFNRTTRVVDVVVAALLLVLASPLLLLAGLGSWLLQGTPVFYRQVRLGQFGRPFVLWKLRTMHRRAELNGPEFCREDDPRVTPLGRLLRRLRVDELPQLYNVLVGDMSLVGPRPERPEFVRQLAEQIPYYSFRLAVPPGLTGWAQVNMPYARTVEEHRRKLEYDLYFIRERSLSLYLMVLLRTVSAALFGVRR
ncbi:MAG: sugar transferase [Thermoanaerobaculum sp.]|nr:sugar transferase [Thermoanaerobaculum sp.]